MSEDTKNPAATNDNANPGQQGHSGPDQAGSQTGGQSGEQSSWANPDLAAAAEATAKSAPETSAERGGAPDPLEALKTENADLRDRLLRAAAEMENLRKRAEREKRDASQYAISKFAHDLLGVGDNMRRALDTVTEDARSAADQVLTGLLDGVEMTERELVKALDKHGVKRIDPQGEKFDPNFHQAMFKVPDPSVASGTVVQVVQIGYKIGERCLRPAMVGVAEGGPKAGSPAGSPASEGSQGAASSGGVDKTA